MDYLSVVEMLNACHGPAGDERQIASTIQRLAEPYADDCWTDTMGNLIVHKKGSGPKVMFAAHMDSIGLIVTHIDEAGYLSFGKLGGVRPEDILHTPFRFKNGTLGPGMRPMPATWSGWGTRRFPGCLPLRRRPAWWRPTWITAFPAQ